MQNTNKEVTISTKVDKKIADELKKIAKQKQIRFSSYVKRVLVADIEKQNQKKEKQN